MSTYTGKFYCTNCQKPFNKDVPKGTTLEEHAKEITCPYCGTHKIIVASSQH